MHQPITNMQLQEKFEILSKKVEFDVLDLYLIHPRIVVSEYKADFELDLDFMIGVF